MPTVEIHEPEVEKLKPANAAAPVLPRKELITQSPAAPRMMFSDSLLEFGRQRKNKTLATTASFILNCLAVGIMLAMPLVFTDTLPKAQLLTFLTAPPPPPPPPPPAAAEQVQKIVRQIQTDLLSTGQLRTPSRIPQKVQMIREDEAPPPMPVGGGVVGGVPGGIPGGTLNGVLNSIVSSSNSVAVPKFTPVAPQRVRISSGVTQGLLIHRVEPAYPPLAKAARIQGNVVLSAVIDINGQIQNLQLVSGHPMLVPAALAAVRQWRYKPYLLNGTPVEVETTITVIFTLSG